MAHVRRALCACGCQPQEVSRYVPLDTRLTGGEASGSSMLKGVLKLCWSRGVVGLRGALSRSRPAAEG